MKKTINGKEYEIERGANLRGANLSEAYLCVANLCEANLRVANLCGANLCGANLCGANLSGANLSGAHLCGANLCGANLCGANLSEANLWGANLCVANLSGANLCGANLCGANLSEANLCGAKEIPPLFHAMSIIAGEGDLIGYKKLSGGVICKIKIPAEARRSNSTGRECRAEYAVVLEGAGNSKYDIEFKYKVGETVRPTLPFNDNRWEECVSGIHFFLTRAEAEDY